MPRGGCLLLLLVDHCLAAQILGPKCVCPRPLNPPLLASVLGTTPRPLSSADLVWRCATAAAVALRRLSPPEDGVSCTAAVSFLFVAPPHFFIVPLTSQWFAHSLCVALFSFTRSCVCHLFRFVRGVQVLLSEAVRPHVRLDGRAAGLQLQILWWWW